MANRQIHELPRAVAPKRDDWLILSDADDQTTKRAKMADFAYAIDQEQAVDRAFADRAGDHVSVKDFGAKGDGLSDDTNALALALQSSVSSVFVPEGRYRLTSPLTLPSGKRLIGAGKHVSILVAEHNSQTLFMAADGVGMCRSALRALSFDMQTTADGIRVDGEDASFNELQFSGGRPDGWGMDLVNCRGAQLRDITMGGPAREFLANGMRWRDGSPSSSGNYGESAMIGVEIRLASPATTALHLAAQNGGLINNMMVAHLRVKAPGTNGAPLAGTTAIRLDSTVRSSFLGISLEALDAGIVETGIASGLGASVGNHYFGVSAINVNTAYQDSNPMVARSVQQRTFSGCDNFPATAGLNDGDSIMPAGLWLQSFVSGDNAVRLRCFSGHELIVDDGAEQGSLALDVGGSSPRVAPKEQGLLTRLFLGRGSSPANNTMRDVTVEPVLRLAPRSSQNPGTTTGQLVYADGVNWDPGAGEGFYGFERGAWRKLAFVN